MFSRIRSLNKMADKTFYWLKMTKDFMKRHDIRIMKHQKDGAEMVNFYISLLLESIDHDAELRYSEDIPYSVEELAIITDTDIEVAERTMDYLKKKGLVEVFDDGTIWMIEASKMMGKESEASERKRKQRANEKDAESLENTECHADVTQMSRECHKNVPLEIEYRDRVRVRDIDEGIYMNNIGDDENAEVQTIPELTEEQIKEIISLWNRNTCVVPIQWITPMTTRYDMTKLCIRYGYELFCEVIKAIDGQALFQKWKERNRLLCYDDFTDPEFFQKIAEGNYKNKFKDTEKTSGNRFNNFEQRQYDFDALEEKLFGGG